MNHVQFKGVNYKHKVNSMCNVENPVPGASSLIDVSLQRTCRRSSRHLQGRYGRPDRQENSQLSRQEVKPSPLVRSYCNVLFTLHITNHEHGDWPHNQHKVCDRAYSSYSTAPVGQWHCAALQSVTGTPLHFRLWVTRIRCFSKWITKFPHFTSTHIHVARSWLN